jgi:hypothetical protein
MQMFRILSNFKFFLFFVHVYLDMVISRIFNHGCKQNIQFLEDNPVPSLIYFPQEQFVKKEF